MNIPFNKNYFTGKELEYVSSAMASNYLQGDGKFSEKCHEKIRELTGANLALLVSSCTSGLELSALLADIEAGDEVIVPTYTFVSSASAFALRGAKIVWCDCRKDTMNIDETKIEALITPKTKALVVMHYAGIACQMDAILDIAKKYNLILVEDAAQALCATYKGKELGTFGDFASYSFHGTKNITCGEGGAIIVNNKKFEDRAYIVREKGTNRRQFVNGVVDKYTWVDIGGSFVASEIAAAFLLAQLEDAKLITKKRVAIYDKYNLALKEFESDGLFTLGVLPSDCTTNAHIFYMILKDANTAKKLALHLKNDGISTASHYAPLHMSPMGIRLNGGKMPSLPVAESLYNRLLRLPMFPELTDDEVSYITDSIRRFKS